MPQVKFVPESFQIPERLESPDFIIRKLTNKDADLDYKAVISSINIIHKTRGGDWPSEDLTLDEDQKDLEWHQKEFDNRASFAYAITSKDGKKYLGCIYLYPPGHRTAISKDADVDVSFWVTQEAYDSGFYSIIYKILDSWLKTAWPFKKVVYTNKVLPM